jgi:hypothetical protein
MYDADNDSDVNRGDSAVLRPMPDLGGMPVEDATGIPTGILYGSLVEAETGLVRYVDLELEALDRHILVPIGHVRVRELEREGPRIRLRAALLEDLEQIPPFPADAAHVDDPFERALLEAYGRTFHGERYYAHPSYDHEGVFAGPNPVVGTDSADPAGLRRLSYLPGWKVAAGEPDIRGWPLALEDGRSLLAKDLVVDTAAGKVRYVVITDAEASLSRLLPIGFLQLDRGSRTVRAPGLTVDDVVALHEYDGGGVGREQEDRLCSELRRRLGGSRRYALPDYRPAARREEG